MATEPQTEKTFACYCGSSFSTRNLLDVFEETGIYVCPDCARLFVQSDENQTPRLLVPFNAFPSPRSERDKREDRYFCPRCGGEAEFNDRNFRADCKDSLCGLSWNYYPSMISPAESDINLEEKVAKKRFGRAEISEEEFLKSLIRLREKRGALKATIL